MKMKRIILPLGALALFGVSAGLMVRTVINPNNIKEVRATSDLVIRTDEEFADFISNCNANSKAYSGQVVELVVDVNATITTKPNNGFDGEFNGNGHTINVDINFDDTESGIFRNLFSNAYFHDVNFAGTVVSRTNASPLCVYNNGFVENVSSSITIDLTDYGYAGGILFRNNSTGRMNNCKFTGAVAAHARAGGIACENQGIISNCINEGSVSSKTDNFVGGIVSVSGVKDSFASNTITGCINKGNIHSANHDVGGIAGFAYSNTKITHCSNYGTITSAGSTTGRAIGGIVGRISGDASSKAGASTCVDYCYNGGNLDTNFITGGLIGMVNSGAKPTVSITGSLSSGKVTDSMPSGSYAGTLIGWANSSNISVSDTWAIGELDATGNNAKYGIGGGSAAGTTYSKAAGVSDEFKQVIRYIREYNCEEISGFKALCNGLSNSEKALLDQLNYYDNLDTYAMKTYGQAAQYIIGGDQAQIAMFSLLNINGLDNNGTAIVVIISALGLSSVLLFLAIRGKRNAANE